MGGGKNDLNKEKFSAMFFFSSFARFFAVFFDKHSALNLRISTMTWHLGAKRIEIHNSMNNYWTCAHGHRKIRIFLLLSLPSNPCFKWISICCVAFWAVRFQFVQLKNIQRGRKKSKIIINSTEKFIFLLFFFYFTVEKKCE